MSDTRDNGSGLHVVLSTGGSYRDIVDVLVAHGATLTALDEVTDHQRGGQFKGKTAIIRQMFSLRTLRLRGLWAETSRVLLVGWQAMPILALIKLGVLPRPRKCVVMGCFVHSQTARRIVNSILKLVRFEGMGFVAFSRAEQESLIQNVGIAADSVLFHLWRQDLQGKVAPDTVVNGSYVFSGGYSNRDYNGLLRAAASASWPLVIVASAHNEIDHSICSRAEIFRDMDESDFELKLAGSRLVVLPLMSTGEACGQSVLLRTLRNCKPVVASRHESIVDYLCDDYPGFVPAGDTAALSAAIGQALSDEAFSERLLRSVSAAQDRLAARESPGVEVYEFLTSGSVSPATVAVAEVRP